MTTITLPDQLGTMPPLETSTALVEGVTTDVRAASTTASDSWATTSAKGVPGDWSGRSADTAGYAFARFGASCDEVTAALEQGSLALEVYGEQVSDLERRRTRLDGDRTAYDSAVLGLRARIDASGPDADVEALRSEAQGLVERREVLEGDRVRWEDDLAAAEDRLVAALQAVDSDAEGAAAAAAPRVDTARLLRELDARRTPQAVHRWWESLTEAEREALKTARPEVVGGTDGIPVSDRDDANRSQLEKDEEYLTGRAGSGDDLSAAQEEQLSHVRAALDAILAGETTIDPVTGRLVDTSLLLYQPLAFGGDGAVAVAYGDPDTADNTAVVVPGLTNDASSIDSQGEQALNLFRASAASGESTSVIAWMGYDAPSGDPADALDLELDLDPAGGVHVDVGISEDGMNLAGVTDEDLATDGGRRLSDLVDGLRATHEGDRGHLAVIGHSYGSTTAAHGASDDGLDADSLTLVGSPGAGSGAPSVEDLGMPEGKVYVGSADNDPVTWLGDRDSSVGLGADPAQADYGATRFDVNDGTDFHVDSIGDGFGNHTSYLEPDRARDGSDESLDNLAAIVNGNEPTEVGGRTQDARDLAREFAEDEAAYWAERGLEELEERGGDLLDDLTGAVGRLPGL